MGRGTLALALVFVASLAHAQQPPRIQSLTQFSDTICPTNGQSWRRVAAGSGYECFTPGGGGGSGDITDVGDCTTGACFTSAGGGTTLFVPLLHGGTAADGDLGLSSTSNADKGAIVVASGLTNVPDITALLAFDASFDMTVATSGLYGYQIGKKAVGSPATWTVDTALTGTGAGGILFAFQPTIKNDAAVPITDMGDWSTLVGLAIFQADGAAVTFPAIRMVDGQFTFNRINAGTNTVTAYHLARDAVTIGAGATVSFRVGLEMVNRAGTGTQTEVYGLYMNDQTVGSFGAALYSGMTSSGSTKFNIYADGTAPSVHNGQFTIGGTTVATAGYDLEVAGKAAVQQGTASDISAVCGVANVNTTTTGNVGSGDDALWTYAIPANTLSTNGDTFSFEAAGTILNDTDQKRLRVKLGATTIYDSGATGIPTSAAIDWALSGTCVRTGAATQKCWTRVQMNNATFAASANGANYATATETLSGAVNFIVSGENTTDTTSNSVVFEMGRAEWCPNNT